MAIVGDDTKKVDGNGDVLKPFYQRASEAEDRIAKLEAFFAKKQGESGTYTQEVSAAVVDLKSKLDLAKNAQEKAVDDIRKLQAENDKLHYRISHLVRALKEKDSLSLQI